MIIEVLLFSYHFMRDLVNEGTIQLSYVPTEENVADIFYEEFAKNQVRVVPAEVTKWH